MDNFLPFTKKYIIVFYLIWIVSVFLFELLYHDPLLNLSFSSIKSIQNSIKDNNVIIIILKYISDGGDKH